MIFNHGRLRTISRNIRYARTGNRGRSRPRKQRRERPGPLDLLRRWAARTAVRAPQTAPPAAPARIGVWGRLRAALASLLRRVLGRPPSAASARIGVWGRLRAALASLLRRVLGRLARSAV